MSSDYRLIFRQPGGPEVIEREPVGPLDPGAGEVVIRQTAVGLNFIDTYQRGGLYPVSLPSGLGSEAAGVVEAIGPDVTIVAPGDRVAYAGGAPAAYATKRTIPAALLTKVPDTIDDRTAAAVMLKGLTADMLAGACARVEAGQTVLVHAAAGGVGALLVPWLKAIGATVIAHAGSAEKADKAQAAGADHAVSVPFDALADTVRSLTDGRGVDVVLDGVGKASWGASLACLRRRGLMVSYGNASGPVPAIEPLVLSRAGSLFLTRPTLYDYLTTAEERQAAADRLFAMIASGKVPVEIGQTFPLEQAAEAHRAIQERRTTGSTVLIP
ncbi:quinone oxidoreductase [uncultured Sphingomonas sp.]|uniref:quinone oxidoreductase family protein n=1 Tax=uncultured Sphingomonas sp. TaxID=158754 RepID=UPI0025F28E78|nr:quinone oxidoreductase [uncultured Sphingomonas sp.]